MQMIVEGRERSAETSVIHLSYACRFARPLFVSGLPLVFGRASVGSLTGL